MHKPLKSQELFIKIVTNKKQELIKGFFVLKYLKRNIYHLNIVSKQKQFRNQVEVLREIFTLDVPLRLMNLLDMFPFFKKEYQCKQWNDITFEDKEWKIVLNARWRHNVHYFVDLDAILLQLTIILKMSMFDSQERDLEYWELTRIVVQDHLHVISRQVHFE